MPLNIAIIGPAATKSPVRESPAGPLPPTSPIYRPPPRRLPRPPPCLPGAFVFRSKARSLVPVLSGNRIEISVLRKPANFNPCTAFSASSWLINAKNRPVLCRHDRLLLPWFRHACLPQRRTMPNPPRTRFPAHFLNPLNHTANRWPTGSSMWALAKRRENT